MTQPAQHGYYIPSKPELGSFGPFTAGSHAVKMAENGHADGQIKLFRWSHQELVDNQLAAEAASR